MVNPNDNLRIFYNLKSKKPSLSAPASDLINEFWHNKNPDVPTDRRLNIPKKIDCGDKFKFFSLIIFFAIHVKKKNLKLLMITLQKKWLLMTL